MSGLSPEGKADIENIIKGIITAQGRQDEDLPEKVAQSVLEAFTKVTEEQPKATHDLPSVADFVQHCESGNCGHSRDWRDYTDSLKRDWLTSLTWPDVKPVAERAGKWPPPTIEIVGEK